MPRRRSSRARSPNRSLGSPAPDAFDTNWLARIRERLDTRYIDLTRIEDRRLWAPDKTWSPPKNIFHGSPRIVVVPQGHRLARFATYNQKYTLMDIYRRKIQRPSYSQWAKERRIDKHGVPYVAELNDTRISPRVGYHLPWQVIVCVRRKRRREVIHALNIAGRSGVGKGKRRRRTTQTEIRC